MIDEALLKNEEKAIFTLRSLYKRYGYSSFKMNKFEEYDFYAKNKGYLPDEGIITFNDRNGKLLALKPDVTLSVIKSVEGKPGTKNKVYYNENIYRVSERTRRYKEIMQMGLENIGDIDFYDIFEVIFLAAKSLASISADFIIDVSHLDILPALLKEAGGDDDFDDRVANSLKEKNVHEIEKLCHKHCISGDMSKKLCEFAGIYGDMDDVLEKLSHVCAGNDEASAAMEELRAVCEYVKTTEFRSNIRFDFSVVNNMNYYNGIVFKGFVKGISEGVLAGGQYDRLMKIMNKKMRAIGFAIYMDLLEDLEVWEDSYDVDVLVLYDNHTELDRLIRTVRNLANQGKRVSVQKAIPDNIRYGESVIMTEQ